MSGLARRVAPGRHRALAGAAVGAVAAVVVLAPVLRRGYTLTYDMVFVPRMPVTATTWGTDGSVPRAVPDDLLVALAGHLLPADIVQKLVLVTVFVLGAAGAARLQRTTVGACAAALTMVWNPWVLERLVIGHWPYLLGLAVLPWAAHAAGRHRDGQPGAAASLAAWVVAAALCGSTSGLVVAATAALVAGWPLPRGSAHVPWWRRLLPVVVPAMLCAAVWVLPALARPGGVPADRAGVTAFSARPDTPLGTWGSLVTLGGLWNPVTWPAERSAVILAVAALVAVLVAAAVGGPALWRGLAIGVAGGGPGLVVAGAAGLVLAGAGATPGLSWLVTRVVLDVPGGGLLRDGQKLLLPTVFLVATCIGLTVDVLRERGPALAPAAVLVALVPVVVLPGLAWGVHGRLGSVPYPAEWVAVQRQVAALPGNADVVSLPFTLYRRLPWDGDRVVLDPMPRLLDRVVLVNDELPLSSMKVRGEDPRAAQVAAAIGSGEPVVPVLRSLGVRLAVVDLTAPDAQRSRAMLAGLPVLHDGPGLLLVDLGAGAPAPRRGGGGQLAAAVLGWLLLALTAVSVAAWRLAAARAPRLLRSAAPAADEEVHDEPGGDLAREADDDVGI